MDNKLVKNAFKHATATVVENTMTDPDLWHEDGEAQKAPISFDQVDSHGRVIGRLVGHIELVDDTTPEQFVKTIREQNQAPPCTCKTADPAWVAEDNRLLAEFNRLKDEFFAFPDEPSRPFSQAYCAASDAVYGVDGATWKISRHRYGEAWVKEAELIAAKQLGA